MGMLMPCIAIAQTSQTKVMLHDIFRTPAPPGDAFAPDGSHVLVVMTVLIRISLGFLAFAISESKRFKTSIPIGLVVASIFCVIPEAVNNYLGGVYWTQSHDPKQLLFMLMGRKFDYYVAFICSYDDAAWGARTPEAVAGTGGGLKFGATEDAA
ncbi:hypothetical protein M438DRAFT_331889 [Aureobasidium pullulans EXF-150]|uniref:Uncharacterized protein n=1 Tax=Aureobasidium pullulans EXF-150 TaxID=1043002 RepID=A0A074XP78_AURPU|nr:uncharacterized protein M438DRAFT_331889 [Aureobasidium pullulans EXF-150]KEQ87358.1 hypothetical protein M438DRAFT_331889 [Aureobasidium pullulans EXF-150]